MKQYKISNVSIVKMMALFSASMLFTPWAAAENLLDVYKTAKDNDAILGAANASFAASKELVPQARSSLLPSIGAQTNTSKINRDILLGGQAVLGEEYNDNSWNAQLRQPVLNLASWYTLGSAKSSVEAASMQLEAESQDLIVAMLNPNAHERLSIDMVLRHPWVLSYRE